MDTAQEKVNRIGEIARTVIQLAGESWKLEPTQFPESLILSNKEGARISIRLNPNGRGSAYPMPPVGIDGYVRDLVEWRVAERNEDLTFTFDISRPVPTLAKSIFNRVIEAYLPLYAMIEIAKSEEANRWKHTAVAAMGFAAALGEEFKPGSPVQTLSVHPKRINLAAPRVEGEFRYWNESASLRIDCTLDQAARIAKVLREISAETIENETTGQ